MNTLPNPGTEPIPQQLIEQVSHTVTEGTHKAIIKMQEYNEWLSLKHSISEPTFIITTDEAENIRKTSINVRKFGAMEQDDYLWESEYVERFINGSWIVTSIEHRSNRKVKKIIRQSHDDQPCLSYKFDPELGTVRIDGHNLTIAIDNTGSSTANEKNDYPGVIRKVSYSIQEVDGKLMMTPEQGEGSCRSYNDKYIRYVLNGEQMATLFPSGHFPKLLQDVINWLNYQPFRGIALLSEVTKHIGLEQEIKEIFYNHVYLGFRETKYLTTIGGQEYDYTILRYRSRDCHPEYKYIESNTHVAIVTDKIDEDVHQSEVQIFKMRIEGKEILETEDTDNHTISYTVGIGDTSYKVTVKNSKSYIHHVRKSTYSLADGEIIREEEDAYLVRTQLSAEEALKTVTNDITAFSRALEKALEKENAN